MFYLRFLAIAALTLALNACVSLSTIKTMQALSSLDPLEDDLASFVFGVMATPSLKVVPESSKFTLIVQANGDGPVETGFQLEPLAASDVAFANLPQDRNKVLSLYKLSDSAKKKVRDHQALIRDMKSKGTTGSFGIGLTPDFCKTTPIDYGREKFTAYLAHNSASELMPLIENMTVKDLLKKAKQSDVPDC